jgi:hypothetical protein
MAGGLVLGAIALGKKHDAQGCASPCYTTLDDGRPNPDWASAHDAYESGRTYATLSTVAVGAGLVATAIGAYFVFRAPSTSARLSVHPVAGSALLGMHAAVSY